MWAGDITSFQSTLDLVSRISRGCYNLPDHKEEQRKAEVFGDEETVLQPGWCLWVCCCTPGGGRARKREKQPACMIGTSREEEQIIFLASENERRDFRQTLLLSFQHVETSFCFGIQSNTYP